MTIKLTKCNIENPSDSKYCQDYTTPLPHPEEVSLAETLETPKEELTIGSTFAKRYEIIEELGRDCI